MKLNELIEAIDEEFADVWSKYFHLKQSSLGCVTIFGTSDHARRVLEELTRISEETLKKQSFLYFMDEGYKKPVNDFVNVLFKLQALEFRKSEYGFSLVIKPRHATEKILKQLGESLDSINLLLWSLKNEEL
jgi:hypothetical protein